MDVKWPTLHAAQGVAELESRSAVPAAHAAHTVVPPLAYVPASHFLHGDLESESVSALPAAQELHLTDAAGANVPCGNFDWSPSHGVAGF